MRSTTLLLLAACAGAPATDGRPADTAPTPPPGTTGDTGEAEGCPILPAQDPWNTDVSGLPVHPDSDLHVDAIGRDLPLRIEVGADDEGAPIGIPYVEVPPDQLRVPVDFLYASESDLGPYPIPPTAPVEGGPNANGDRHLIVLDREACRLYELAGAWPIDFGVAWRAEAGAIFDLRSGRSRPDGWRSADPSGLPIFPGLVRRDEVSAGAIRHALRIRVPDSRAAYVPPATSAASTHLDPALPPMGLRLRLKAEVACGALPADARVVCEALRTYGALVSDHGPAWTLTTHPDATWDQAALAALEELTGDDFEVVDTGPAIPEP